MDMRMDLKKVTVGFCLAALLASCTKDEGTDNQGDLEATVIGSWQSTIQVGAGQVMTVDIVISPDGTALMSRSMGGGVVGIEAVDWSISESKFQAEKTECKSPDSTGQLVVSTCQEPLQLEYPISLQDGKWAIDHGGIILFFEKIANP